MKFKWYRPNWIIFFLLVFSIFMRNVGHAETPCDLQAKPEVAQCYDKTEPTFYCVTPYNTGISSWKAGCRSTVAKELGYLKEGGTSEGDKYTKTIMRAKGLEMYKRHKGVK